MNNMQLAATKNWLLKPFALLLALIFNGLFIVLKQITTEQALAIDIILFTFIVRAAMMPLMIRQQRSTRRMTLLQPKIDKIQAKYQNKKDPESTQKMNMEIQKLYSDNKANPMSGCLPLLIQMPIIFALFEVLRNVPFYVNDIGALFKSMAGIIMDQNGYADVLSSNFASIIKGIKNFDATSVTSVMDVLQHLSRTQWATLMSQLNLTGNSTFMEAYKLQEAYNTVGFGVFTFNLSENPALTNWSIIFPILSALSTFLQSFLTQRANDKRQKLISPDGKVPQQQASMKVMTYVFPIMTFFFAINMPIGICVYWIVSNIFALLATWIADSVIDKEEYREALKHRDELIEKRKQQESRQSAIDVKTGGRLGTRNTMSKSSLAGNKIAAMNEQQKKRTENQTPAETTSVDKKEETDKDAVKEETR